MDHRRLNFFLLIICSVVLISVPGYWLIRSNEVNMSIQEGRWLNTFWGVKPSFQDFKTDTKRILDGQFDVATSIFYGKWLTHSYQTGLEQAGMDQFPLRIPLINATKWVERRIIDLVSLFHKDAAVSTCLSCTTLVLRDAPILLSPPGYFADTMENAIDLRIENLDLIIDENPETNFYVLYIDEIGQSTFHPLNSYFPHADRGQSIQYFEQNKPEKLVLEKWVIEDLSAYQELFYHTDHHWNTYGMWKAYEQIYHMLARSYPDIPPMLVPRGLPVLHGVEFCGSHIRSSFYPCVPDEFHYVDVDLPSYTVYVNGEEKQVGHQDEFLSGTFPLEKYSNVYGDFWGDDYALIEYHFEINSNRNLLLIGDSYSNSLDPFVASHYQDTYVVDLRFWKDFSIHEMIETYQIDDVLILGSPVVLYNESWTINP